MIGPRLVKDKQPYLGFGLAILIVWLSISMCATNWPDPSSKQTVKQTESPDAGQKKQEEEGMPLWWWFVMFNSNNN